MNREPSSDTHEQEKGVDKGMYNPALAEARRLESRRIPRPRLMMSDEAWNTVKPQLEKRWSPEEADKWLEKEYPCYAMSGKTIYNYVFSYEKGTEKDCFARPSSPGGGGGKKY
ncbi:MAG: hypothetical protein LBK73_11645 [Treponema sp.]|nr:hypothetical protein [Treponema sp.]